MMNGAKFNATWEHGKVISGDYVFEDDLKYEEKDWEYCTLENRSFWQEDTSQGMLKGM